MKKLDSGTVQSVLQTIPEQILEKLIEIEAYIAGGYIRDTIIGWTPSDLDVYAKEGHEHDLTAAAEWLAGWASTLPETSPRIITVPTGDAWPDIPKVQFITGWPGSPTKTIGRFDFTCCAVAIYHDGSRWRGIAEDTFQEDSAALRLVYRRPIRLESLPAASLWRVLRFVRRGWTIDGDSLGGVVARLVSEGKQYEETQILDRLQALCTDAQSVFQDANSQT